MIRAFAEGGANRNGGNGANGRNARQGGIRGAVNRAGRTINNVVNRFRNRNR